MARALAAKERFEKRYWRRAKKADREDKSLQYSESVRSVPKTEWSDNTLKTKSKSKAARVAPPLAEKSSSSRPARVAPPVRRRLTAKTLAKATEAGQHRKILFDFVQGKWKESRFRERVQLQRLATQQLRGSIRTSFLQILGSACSTCGPRRRIATEAARQYATVRAQVLRQREVQQEQKRRRESGEVPLTPEEVRDLLQPPRYDGSAYD